VIDIADFLDLPIRGKMDVTIFAFPFTEIQIVVCKRGRVSHGAHRDGFGEGGSQPRRNDNTRVLRGCRHPQDHAEDLYQSILSAQDHIA
jgi:hypothetical protein